MDQRAPGERQSKDFLEAKEVSDLVASIVVVVRSQLKASNIEYTVLAVHNHLHILCTVCKCELEKVIGVQSNITKRSLKG